MEDFDAEKILNMSREELIGLLGNELSVKLNEKLANGTITYKEFEEMCKSAFKIPQQANLVRNAILLKLSKSEGFNMFESNKEKQQQYAEIANLQEKAENGKLNIAELKRLCDIAFGEDTELSKKIQIQFIEAGKVKEDNTEMERD